MDTSLSAAEIKTLQSPENEQVKSILPLLLKELALKRWVKVQKGTRPTNYLLFGFLMVGAIGLIGLNWAVGIGAIFVLAIAFYVSTQPKILISITPLGAQKLKSFGADSPFLVSILNTIAMARKEELDNCTNKEWRKHLGEIYPDNASFHKDCLLASLEHKGLIKHRNDPFPQRTAAGDAALARAEAEIELGTELPRLLREGNPQAAVLAASLGGMLLLQPDMEGYFHMLGSMTGFPEMNLEEDRRQQRYAGSDSGGMDSGSGDTEQKEEDTDNDNGSDWGENADFLDGDLGDGNDSGIGSDGGCGVGGDSSDGGGDGGCGGCGGGGD
jgi:uncharacterized membrane protein YgcG